MHGQKRIRVEKSRSNDGQKAEGKGRGFLLTASQYGSLGHGRTATMWATGM